jgi:hypothetical protein
MSLKKSVLSSRGKIPGYMQSTSYGASARREDAEKKKKRLSSRSRSSRRTEYNQPPLIDEPMPGQYNPISRSKGILREEFLFPYTDLSRIPQERGNYNRIKFPISRTTLRGGRRRRTQNKRRRYRSRM